MATYLITGIAGFIGSSLARAILAQGDKVRGIDNFSTGQRANLEEILSRIEFREADLLDLDAVKHACQGVDYVLHQAAIPSVPKSVLDPLGSNQANVDGTVHVLIAARDAKVKRVVYASSVAVSGQQSNFGDRLATEDDPTYGTSQYAMHKIFNEFQAKKYIKNYGMSITGVRPANVTGPDKLRGSTDHVQIMTEAARGKPVHLPKKGLMRLLVHVEDMAEVFARVLLADAPRHDLYNSGGIPVSLGELADIVRGFLPDAQITFAQEGGREDSGNYLVDNSRLATEFGIEYPGLHTRVLEVINDVRRQEGLPLVPPA